MFDILVHLTGMRESSCNEGKTISLSCSSVLLFFLFFVVRQEVDQVYDLLFIIEKLKTTSDDD